MQNIIPVDPVSVGSGVAFSILITGKDQLLPVHFFCGNIQRMTPVLFNDGKNTVPILLPFSVDLQSEMNVGMDAVLLFFLAYILNVKMLPVEFLHYGLHGLTEI